MKKKTPCAIGGYDIGDAAPGRLYAQCLFEGGGWGHAPIEDFEEGQGYDLPIRYGYVATPKNPEPHAMAGKFFIDFLRENKGEIVGVMKAPGTSEFDQDSYIAYILDHNLPAVELARLVCECVLSSNTGMSQDPRVCRLRDWSGSIPCFPGEHDPDDLVVEVWAD